MSRVGFGLGILADILLAVHPQNKLWGTLPALTAKCGLAAIVWPSAASDYPSIIFLALLVTLNCGKYITYQLVLLGLVL